MTAKFSDSETQEDRFAIDVLPAPEPFAASPKGPRIALFDPVGETARSLDAMRILVRPVAADADLSSFAFLVVGKGALTIGGAAPDLARVRDGLKVLVFEQIAEALEQRLGFRVQEYGLRQVFPRVPDHPALAGITAEQLRDWRGAATILPARLKYELRPRYGPTVRWAGLPATRVWRCGNRGNVASVLIEKPIAGDFLPVVDGGFSLQYSPLMEFHEGRGMALFCQLDVTGRTEREPVAEQLTRNLLRYVSAWEPRPRRRVVYAGEPEGRAFLEALKIPVGSSATTLRPAEDVLVIGPDGGRALAARAGEVAAFLKGGGRLLSVGLGQDDASAVLPFPVTLRTSEHIASFFDAPEFGSTFAGVSPADVHNRDPRAIPLVTGGAAILGDGVLAKTASAEVVFVQMAPWRFEGGKQANLRRTSRRASFLLGRVLANLGVAGPTPLLERFGRPVAADSAEKRWLDGFYLDQPEEWDDPYRFFRW